MRVWWLVGIAMLFCVTSSMAQTLSIAATNTLTTIPLTTNPTPSQVLNVRTSWTTGFSIQLTVCVYMTSPLAGTGTNVVTIPASTVRVNGTSIVTGATNCGVPTATQIARQFFLFGTSSRTDALTIDINGYSAALPPDTYTGTINLVAVIQ